MKCQVSLILMKLTQKLKVVYCWCEYVWHIELLPQAYIININGVGETTSAMKIVHQLSLSKSSQKWSWKVPSVTSAFYKTWVSLILMESLLVWPRKLSLDVWSTRSDHENNIHPCYIIDSGSLNTWELNLHCPKSKVTTTFQTSNSLILMGLENNGKTYMTDYLVGVYQ